MIQSLSPKTKQNKKQNKTKNKNEKPPPPGGAGSDRYRGATVSAGLMPSTFKNRTPPHFTSNVSPRNTNTNANANTNINTQIDTTNTNTYNNNNINDNNDFGLSEKNQDNTINDGIAIDTSSNIRPSGALYKSKKVPPKPPNVTNNISINSKPLPQQPQQQLQPTNSANSDSSGFILFIFHCFLLVCYVLFF